MPTADIIDPKRIVVLRNTRQRQEKIHDYEALKQSIAATGLINPISVRTRGDEIILLAGERRLMSCLALGMEEIPILNFGPLTEEAAEVIELEENAKRQDLEWRDKVKTLGRLHGLYLARSHGWTIEQTAFAASISSGYLRKALHVFASLDSPKIKQAESIEQAYGMLAKFAERKAESIVNDIIANGASMFAGGELAPTKPAQAPPEDYTFQQPIKSFEDAPQAAAIPSSGLDNESLLELVTGAASAKPAPSAPMKPSAPILNVNFLEWAKEYSGPKFSLIHCDFPYGNYRGEDSQGAMTGVETEAFYDNHESIYWDLLKGLTENLDRLMSYSAHLIFWFNMNFYTETVRQLRATGLMVHDHPLIWHKTEGGGGGRGVVPGTATTYPRRLYDTALLAVRGNRPLANPGDNSYGAPTVGNKIHPSQKPEPMLRHFLRMVVDETTTVLDPTCGSAAALRAAEDLGARSVLGLELDANYALSANQRTIQARVLRQAGASRKED